MRGNETEVREVNFAGVQVRAHQSREKGCGAARAGEGGERGLRQTSWKQSRVEGNA